MLNVHLSISRETLTCQSAEMRKQSLGACGSLSISLHSDKPQWHIPKLRLAITILLGHFAQTPLVIRLLQIVSTDHIGVFDSSEGFLLLFPPLTPNTLEVCYLP